jgi:lipopolysaccharide export system ATP-binding protein
MSQLQARDLVKWYGKRCAVDGVSLAFGRGEVVGLLGPNGAGKTTSFYLMLGLTRPNGGQVFLDGVEITPLPLHRRARLGLAYLPQEACIFRHLSVEDNLLAVLEASLLGARERRTRKDELLEELAISPFARQPASVLSGGERRRVEIARALATQPSFLLLDEPFTGVDPIAVAELQEIILRLRSRDIGILLTDHNVRDTLAITDRSYIIHQGKILTAGASAELLDDPLARQFYLGERFRM